MAASRENPLPDVILVEGPKVLMAVACQECRMVMFSRSPEESVNLGLGHAQECGTEKMTVVELVTAKDLPVDIEDRAEKWVLENHPEYHLDDDLSAHVQDLIDAYLAGVGQARADEAAHQQYLASKRLDVGLGPPGVGQ